jgi:hypothetical protein
LLEPMEWMQIQDYLNCLNRFLITEIANLVLEFCDETDNLKKQIQSLGSRDCHSCLRDREDIFLCYYVGNECRRCGFSLCLQCYELFTRLDFDTAFNSCLLCASDNSQYGNF